MNNQFNTYGYGAALERKLSETRYLEARKNDLTHRSYNMASTGRMYSDWTTFVTNFNYDIRSGGKKMIARGRDLAQNDPYAKKILRLLEKNVVGPNGFLFKNKSGTYDATGKMVYDKLANLKIENAFYRWSQKEFATVTGSVSFRKVCQQAMRSVWMDGEIFFKEIKGSSANKYGYTLQLIDATYVDHNLNVRLDNNRAIVMGVEVDNIGRKLAYYIKKYDPQSVSLPGFSASTSIGSYERITADKLIHLYIEEVPGQIRGITQFAPAGIRLKMLGDFEESGLKRAKASARIPGVIQQRQNTVAGDPMNPDGKDADGNWVVELEDGQWFVVKDGYEQKSFESDFPHPLHKEFLKSNLRGISAGQDLAYSAVSGDYESVTWHSSKIENQDQRDGFMDLQQWMIESMLNRVAYNWLDMSLMSGAINLPPQKLEQFYAPNFIGRGWQYTNPKEEIDADIDGLRAGIVTMEDVLAKRGIDMDDHFEQLAREAEMRKEYSAKGVVFDWIGKPAQTSNPANQNADKDKDNQQSNNDNKNNKQADDITAKVNAILTSGNGKSKALLELLK